MNNFKAIFVLALFASILMIGCDYTNVKTITCKVTDKGVKRTGSGQDAEDLYLIYTDKGTFKIEDQLFYGKFNSSDLYGKIMKDSTYTFKVGGYRVGITSSYPNIIKILDSNEASFTKDTTNGSQDSI